MGGGYSEPVKTEPTPPVEVSRSSAYESSEVSRSSAYESSGSSDSGGGGGGSDD